MPLTVYRESSVEPEFRVLDSEPGHFVFVAYENLTIFVWSSEVSLDALQRLKRATDPIYRASPHGVSNIHVALHGTGLPAPKARDYMLQLMNERAEQRACLGAVLMGSGFWASAVRSFITGIRFVAPRKFDFGVHSSLEAAATWISPLHVERTQTTLRGADVLYVLKKAHELALHSADK